MGHKWMVFHFLEPLEAHWINVLVLCEESQCGNTVMPVPLAQGGRLLAAGAWK